MKTAAELLQIFESGLIHARKIDIGFYYFLASWDALLRGDLLSAAKFNEIASKAVTEVNTHFPIAAVRYWEAQVLFELGKHTETEAQLHLSRELGRHIKSKQIEYWYLLANAQFALGIRAAKPDTTGGENGQSSLTVMQSRSKESQKRGLDALRKAMELGREQGYVNMFGWRSDIMPRLCVEALEAGIEVAYVQDLIRKRQIIPDVPPLECENWPWPLRIFTLGQFVLLKEGELIRFSGKVQHKPMELLKALVSFGGREVSEDQLVDVLWPDAEGDMAHQSFDTTLYHLRRLIGNDMAIQLHGGLLTLDDRYCCVDTWAFERVFERFEVSFKKIGASEKGETPGTPFTDTSILRENLSQTEATRLAGKAISIYKGAFLPADTRYLWTMSFRERLRNKFIRVALVFGDYLGQTGQWQMAAGHYQKVIEIDDLVEEFYQRLMVCHHHLGQKAEVVKAYNRCRTMLSAALGITPSPNTETIYNNLARK